MTALRKITALLLIFNSSLVYAQSNQISILEKKKMDLQNQIEVLNDSIKKIDHKIESIKTGEIMKSISDSTLRAVTKNGAKLKKAPDPLAEIIFSIDEAREIIILDYSNNYFGVCAGNLCGYMSEIWINKTPEIEDFIVANNFEVKELERLQKERGMKAEKEKWMELEKMYVKKYGQKDYSKMKQGYFWIGMNKEMATISLGSPNKINRSVGPWGVHEQWVYDILNLYFENGKLTSYQD